MSQTRISIRSAIASLAVATGASLALVDTAAAAMVGASASPLDGATRISFSAAPGEANDVVFDRVSAGFVRVTDRGSAPTPIAPCIAGPDVSSVDCPVGSTWVVSASLGDLDDRVAFAGSAASQPAAGEATIDDSFIDGEAGNDELHGTVGRDTIEGGDGSDLVDGGPGADQLRGGPGDDRLLADDSLVDHSLDCGPGEDRLRRDNVDPSAVGCEAVETLPALMRLTFLQRMPDLLSGAYAGMSAEEAVDAVSHLFPARLDAAPLTYAAARALAKREPKPFDLLAQEPPPGAGVAASVLSPQKIKLYYWDPSDDAVKQACTPAARVRAKAQKSKGLKLTEALRGAEFREGVAGNEGEAQELLRRFGCRYETKLVFSRSLENGSRVLGANFKKVVTKKKVNGRTKRVVTWRVLLNVKVAKSGNDFIVIFSDNPNAAANHLPLSDKSRAAKRQPSALRIFLREVATGRAAVGATVELRDGDVASSRIAAGKTDADGHVDLQFRAAGPGDLNLYAFKQAKDPASGELITQDATMKIVSTTPDKTWASLGGRTYRQQADGGYKRVSGVAGASASALATSSSVAEIINYARQVSLAMQALAIADLEATALGLTVSQARELTALRARMLGLNTNDAGIAKLLGLTTLEPSLAVGAAGPICDPGQAPKLEARLMPGFAANQVVVGGGVVAKIDCGRRVLTTPSGLALLPQGWASGTGRLIANDGAGLIANDGASLIANDGASLIANDGASLLANDGAGLIANDGASYLPVSKLMSDHGAGIVSNHSGAMTSAQGGSFNPLLGATSLMSLSGR